MEKQNIFTDDDAASDFYQFACLHAFQQRVIERVLERHPERRACLQNTTGPTDEQLDAMLNAIAAYPMQHRAQLSEYVLSYFEEAGWRQQGGGHE